MLSSAFSLTLADKSDRLSGLKELRAPFVNSQAHFGKKSLKLYLGWCEACMLRMLRKEDRRQSKFKTGLGSSSKSCLKIESKKEAGVVLAQLFRW